MAGKAGFPLSLQVRGISVKPIKDALEAHQLLDKRIKITPSSDDNHFNIPLKSLSSVEWKYHGEQEEDGLSHLLSAIGMEKHAENVSISWENSPNYNDNGEDVDRQVVCNTRKNIKFGHLEPAFHEWLNCLPTSVKTSIEEKLLSTKRFRYVVYPPLLLLSPSSFSNFLSDEEISSHLSLLYECLSKHLNVTHIALNAPISTLYVTENLEATLNIMRSPSGLTPLHGDFGPSLPANQIPTSSDFQSAFWCSTKQNEIFQTWAPRYSMFSRGNISEKARILRLAQRGGTQSCRNNPTSTYIVEDSTAVDLYAGIGYFAFSYVKAGLSIVFCWEINPWSVEALRRGAVMNQWKTMIVRGSEDDGFLSQRIYDEQPRLVIFEENNDKASGRIKALLSHHPSLRFIPPIKHVNCGSLPSSKDSWKTAVDLLDDFAGGWIHVHENIKESVFDARREEINAIFGGILQDKFALAGETDPHSALCSHLEQVKSYAPGIIHCVLDMYIS